MDLLRYTKHSLYHLGQVAGQERWLFIQALLLLPMVKAALRLFGFQRVYTLLSRLAGTRQTPLTDAQAYDIGHRMHRAMRRASRVNPEALCLPRSLVHWWLLRRQGLAAELRIGVRLVDDQFAAHAWVECGGHVVNDRADVAERYAPFDQPIVPHNAVLR